MMSLSFDFGPRGSRCSQTMRLGRGGSFSVSRGLRGIRCSLTIRLGFGTRGNFSSSLCLSLRCRTMRRRLGNGSSLALRGSLRA
jgi:hypothetical protein